jgi:cell division protein ZapA (FtsZ GTPase activity inhibitor)
MAGNRGTAERLTRVAADLDAKANEMEKRSFGATCDGAVPLIGAAG